MTTNIMNCDLVVLGAGGCGLVAAVKAADVSGKKVIVLEKAKKPGGATTFAHGMQISNSKWQIAAGLTSQTRSVPGGAPAQTGSSGSASGASVAKERVAGGPSRGGGPGPGATPDVSGQFFDWLVEKGGAEKYFKVSKPGDKVPMMASYPCRPAWTSIKIIRTLPSDPAGWVPTLSKKCLSAAKRPAYRY